MLTLLADVYVAHGDAGGLLNLLIYLVVIAVIMGLLWWVLGLIPLPGPVKTALTVIFALIAAIIVIDILLGFVGHPLFH
jgi:hypothetical protein